jgi:poly-gamma-glutamate biosynthesis protein PgsC/CapC
MIMEWLAVSIGIGLLVSLLFTEAFGLNVGGMIVPGYLAMSMDQPLTILLTIFAALMTWGCVRLVHRRAILFGRRRVVITMVVGFAVAALIRGLVLPLQPAVSTTELAAVTVIGFMIPGLIALWMDRTGFVQTMSPLIVATSLVRLVLIIFAIEAVA